MEIILYPTENIRRLNQQITDDFNRNIEILEDEVLKLTNLLILHGTIFKQNEQLLPLILNSNCLTCYLEI
jgi:hypothetical protein